MILDSTTKEPDTFIKSVQWNGAINNKEISSAKTFDNQDLSKDIRMENEQSYDVRNNRRRGNKTIPFHSELQRRKHSDYQVDTAESMDRKKSNEIMQGCNHRFLGDAMPMGGHNLPPPP